jgi:hypothetical protein
MDITEVRTLKEALTKLTELEHSIAVYENLIAHLEEFLNSDVGPAEYEIHVDNCSVPTVPEEVIERAVFSFEKRIKELKRAKKALEELELGKPIEPVVPGAVIKKRPKKITK